MTDDIETIAEKRICTHCIEEPYLRRLAVRGELASCDYCDRRAGTMSIGELASEVEGAFERHYRRTSPDPQGWQLALMADREGSYEFERSGEPVVWAISEAAMIDEDAASDIQVILEDRYYDHEMAQMSEETQFGPDSHYEVKDANDIEFQLDWTAFERSLKTETRFFSRAAEAMLGRIFGGMEGLETVAGAPVVRAAGPGTGLEHLFRARVFHDDTSLEAGLGAADRQLGPPPSAAAAANRMNARGISVFYGATHAEVALAEVRPPVGSRVAVARFQILRPLRLLDIEAIKEVYVEGSYFDPTYLQRLEWAKFLGRLSQRMTSPVMPGDDAQDYLITQAIADYLSAQATPALDGLIYPSVQAEESAERNVVLFNKAARVEALARPKGATVQVSLRDHTDEGPEESYLVWEDRRTVEPDFTPAPKGWPSFQALSQSDPFAEVDMREVTLAVAVETLSVHHVTSVKIAATEHPVPWHVLEK